MTLPTKRAVQFFALLLGMCVVLMWPSPTLERTYGRMFVACGNGLISLAGGDEGLLGTSGVAKLVADYSGDPQHDVQIGVMNRKHLRSQKDMGARRTSSRHLGYMPAATLVALTLAAPVAWRRKAWALLWGLLLVHAFVALRFVLVLLNAFHGVEPYALFLLDTPWRGLFRALVNIIVVVPATTYLVALVIWGAVTFRKEDLVRLTGMPGLQSEPSRAPSPDRKRAAMGRDTARKPRKKKRKRRQPS